MRNYRALLATPWVPWLLATSMVARAPMGMTTLAMILVFASSGSYAHAGAVVAVFILGSGVSGPLLGRALDRFGYRAVLVPCSIAFAGATVALALTADQGGATVYLVALLTGIVQPPMSTAARSLWAVVLEGPRREAMYALEATLQELVFIAGPAIVAAVAAALNAKASLVASGVLAALGTIAYVASPATARRPLLEHERPPRTGLFVPDFVRMLVVGAVLVAALSIVEVGIVKFMSGDHASAGSGIAFAVWSSGSLIGGAIYGARSRAIGLAALTLVVALGFAALAASPDRVVLVVVLGVGGLAIAPLLAGLYLRTGAAAPEGRSAEAFGWLATGLLVGGAAGSAVGGLVVSSAGARVDFLVGAGVLLVAPVVLATAKRAVGPAGAAPALRVESVAAVDDRAVAHHVVEC
jgi:MFS family permease